MLNQQWAGAEIESCCDIADRCGISVEEAAEYIVPVSKAAASQLAALEEAAAGKFLSASRPGVYEKRVEKVAARAIREIE